MGGLISVSDRIIGTNVWAGEMFDSFKEITGKPLDVDKAISNQEYQETNKDALKEAKIKADEAMLDSVASSNPFQGILKNQKPPSEQFMLQMVREFDAYMTRFRVFEFESARKAIANIKNPRTMTRGKATRLLAATVGRMVVYDQIRGLLLNQMLTMFGLGDEEKDKDITMLTNSFAAAIITLTIGRNFGNVQNALMNMYVEELNKEYGGGITYKDEYNKYRDSVVFGTIQTEGYNSGVNTLINMTGAYSPALKKISSYYSKKGTKDQSKRNQMHMDMATEAFLYWLSLPREAADILKARQRNDKNFVYPLLRSAQPSSKSKRKQKKRKKRKRLE